MCQSTFTWHFFSTIWLIASTDRGQLAKDRSLLDRAIVQGARQHQYEHRQSRLSSVPAKSSHCAAEGLVVEITATRRRLQGAADLARFSPLQWQDQLEAAQILIRCFSSASADAKLSLPEREADARDYAEQAEMLLREVTGLIEVKADALNELGVALGELRGFAFLPILRTALALADESDPELVPEDPANWSTLGVAYYRVGNSKRSIESLGHSMQLFALAMGATNRFVTMIYWHEGDKDLARPILRQGRQLEGESVSPTMMT